MFHDLVEEVSAQISGFVIQQPEVEGEETHLDEIEVNPEEEL